MSWAEIKSAVNSTVGAALKPLDQIILEQAGENYYNTAKLIADTSGVPDAVFIAPRVNTLSSTDVPSNKNAITDIILSPETKTIGVNVFSGLTAITDVYAPFVETLQVNSFLGCTKLKSIVLGRALKSIELGAFNSCNALEEIHYGGSVAEWSNVSKAAGGIGYTNPTVYCIDGTVKFAD